MALAPRQLAPGGHNSSFTFIDHGRPFILCFRCRSLLSGCFLYSYPLSLHLYAAILHFRSESGYVRCIISIYFRIYLGVLAGLVFLVLVLQVVEKPRHRAWSKGQDSILLKHPTLLDAGMFFTEREIRMGAEA